MVKFMTSVSPSSDASEFGLGDWPAPSPLRSSPGSHFTPEFPSIASGSADSIPAREMRSVESTSGGIGRVPGSPLSTKRSPGKTPSPSRSKFGPSLEDKVDMLLELVRGHSETIYRMRLEQDKMQTQLTRLSAQNFQGSSPWDNAGSAVNLDLVDQVQLGDSDNIGDPRIAGPRRAAYNGGSGAKGRVRAVERGGCVGAYVRGSAKSPSGALPRNQTLPAQSPPRCKSADLKDCSRDTKPYHIKIVEDIFTDAPLQEVPYDIWPAILGPRKTNVHDGGKNLSKEEEIIEDARRGGLWGICQPLLKPGQKPKVYEVALRRVEACLAEKMRREEDLNRWMGPEPPLRVAVEQRSVDFAKVLLEAKGNPDETDSKKVSLLHMATFNGQVEMVKMLLDLKADPNSVDRFDQTPIFFAPTRLVCETLFQAFADVNAMNHKGQSALHLAAKAGLGDVLTYLCERVTRALLCLRDSAGMWCTDYARTAGIRPNVIQRVERMAKGGLGGEPRYVAGKAPRTTRGSQQVVAGGVDGGLVASKPRVNSVMFGNLSPRDQADNTPGRISAGPSANFGGITSGKSSMVGFAGDETPLPYIDFHMDSPRSNGCGLTKSDLGTFDFTGFSSEQPGAGTHAFDIGGSDAGLGTLREGSQDEHSSGLGSPKSGTSRATLKEDELFLRGTTKSTSPPLSSQQPEGVCKPAASALASHREPALKEAGMTKPSTSPSTQEPASTKEAGSERLDASSPSSPPQSC